MRESTYIRAVLCVGGTVLAVSVGSMIASPPDVRWVGLAVLTVIGAQLMLRMPSMPISFSVSDIFTFTAALMFGPAAGAVVAGIDAAVMSSRLTQTTRLAQRIVFNVTAAGLAMAISSKIFFVVARTAPFSGDPSAVLNHPLALAAFAFVYFVLNTALVAMAIAFGTNRGAWVVWRDHFMGLWPGYAGGASAAGLGLFLFSARSGDMRVLSFVMPIPFILYVTFRTAVAKMNGDVEHLTRINAMYLTTIETLAQAVDARDEITHDHLRRVQRNTMRLARHLQVTDELQLRAIEAAALLHDIGKLAIPEHILNKPDKLTPTEYEAMKLHAKIGADILAPVGFPFPVVPIVRHHHENWDGSGYPDGLKGEAIPIGARILSVADCFDALTSNRPYRRAFSQDKALTIIQEHTGVMYDPRVVDALFAIRGEIVAGSDTPEPAAAVAESIAQARQAAKSDVPDVPITVTTVHAAGRIGAIVGEHADLRALSQALADELSLRLPGLTLVLYRYDQQLDALYARAAGGIHAIAVEGLTIGLGLRLTGWVGAHRATIANSEAALDLGNIASQLRPIPQLCLSTPIIAQGRLAGVLTVYSSADRAFTPADVAVFEMLAGLLAPKLTRELLGQQPHAPMATRP
jgi:putative nucleotidyltransferase with HDIG domain